MDKRFGINMKKWCRDHEAYVTASLEKTPSKEALDELLLLHEKKLSWLMHERLVHLIVTFIIVILALFSMALVLFLPDTLPFSLPLFVIAFVLLVFYLLHYFFLENTVQKWYVIDQSVTDLIQKTASP